MWEALIHSILISEAREKRCQILASSLGNYKTGKTLKCYFELILNIFNRKR